MNLKKGAKAVPLAERAAKSPLLTKNLLVHTSELAYANKSIPLDERKQIRAQIRNLTEYGTREQQTQFLSKFLAAHQRVTPSASKTRPSRRRV